MSESAERVAVVLTVVAVVGVVAPMLGTAGATAEGDLATETTIPEVQWDQTYPTFDNPTQGQDLAETPDGGFVAVATISPTDSPGVDTVIRKVGPDGEQEWAEYIRTPDDKVATAVTYSQNGYVLAGYDETGENAEQIWVAKYDQEGNLVWERFYGGGQDERAYDITTTADGGLAVAGFTASRNVESAWLLKLDVGGLRQWSGTYDAEMAQRAHAVEQLDDGGFVLVGEADGPTGPNPWVLRTDAEGEKRWHVMRNTEAVDLLRDVTVTEDGYAAVGYRKLSEERNAGLVVLTSTGGSVTAAETLQLRNSDQFYGVAPGPRDTEDRVLIAGVSKEADDSRTGDVDEARRSSQAVLVELRMDFNYRQSTLYGAEGYDDARAVIQTEDGGYAFTGVRTDRLDDPTHPYITRTVGTQADTTQPPTTTAGTGGGTGDGTTSADGGGVDGGGDQVTTNTDGGGTPGFAPLAVVLALAVVVVAAAVRNRR